LADKPEPGWVAPFLAALAETGNVTWSARQANVDFTTVYGRRNRHPGFAAAWARALAERAEAHRGQIVPPAMPGRRGNPAPPEDLIERVCSRNGPQLVRMGAGRWSKRAEQEFLTALATCANARRAAAAVGFSPTALYRRRLKDRHFADAWEAAVAAGRSRVDAYLVEAADRTFDPDSLEFDSDLPKMTIAEAIKVMQLAQRKNGGPAAGKPASQRGWIGPESWDDADDEDAVDLARDAIFNRLERMRENDEEKKLAAGWTRDGEDWVPPGYVKLVDLEALPPAEDEPEEEPAAPRVRRL
jgi:hypothetical protein